ncbi:MAG: hypothetical protein A2176_09850 [Spirochaetes bacterium RBG_13_51_14]|nr:MAG: hypothetical protein A2176_09850 [Spirochaetes bacterium RBG_13_51_14]
MSHPCLRLECFPLEATDCGMHHNTANREILEVWDWENGLPTGDPVARDIAHRDGTPHESVHLWIVRNIRTETQLLFQHRAAHKEYYPDCLDITVGGHVPYGFGGNKVLKETYEEIGIIPDEKNLIDLGWYRYEEKNDRHFQRELQHVFLLEDNRDLDRYHFKDGEVSGLYAVRLDDLRRIIAGDVRIEVSVFTGKETIRKTIARKDFHPQLFDSSMYIYMRVVLRAAEELSAAGRVTTTMPDL